LDDVYDGIGYILVQIKKVQIMLCNLRLLISIVLVSILVGCSTPGTPNVESCKKTTAARTGDRWKCLTTAYEQEENERKSLQCKKFGFKEGSDSFSNCLMQLELAKKNRAKDSADEPIFTAPKILNCTSIGNGLSQCR
jgi:hypothetical protein